MTQHHQETSFHDKVSMRAFEKWQARGCPPGDGVQDWFAAQAEIEKEKADHDYEVEIAIYDPP